MLYNANLDRSSPTRKSKHDLRNELKKWENEKVKKKKNVVEDGVAYEVT
jgi:E3 ubiquitin-protein ligase RAD18